METVLVKIRRQDDPGDLPYWEKFEVERREGMTVVGLLLALRENPVTVDGNRTAPVVWESSCRDGLCGSCAMVINGRVRLACHTVVEELSEPVTLEPLSKFPVLRDLKVDRARMFDALGRILAWIDLDGIHAHGPALRIAPEAATRAAPVSACIMCGACSEACPQVNERSAFAGAFLFAHADALSAHPLGSFGDPARMDELLGRGGIADCAGAGVCSEVCPARVPLVESIARVEGKANSRALKRLLGL
ncbi:MAG TPA: succinate dehydrogenase iron-sulfur subunit [bacterium]|nr:succinate dehydrogenase iron-sulfur subunit [bacterium]